MNEQELDQVVSDAMLYIADSVERQPTLEEVAGRAGLSPQHFQRVFQRRVGVSPKRLLQVLTLDRAKALLDGEESVLQATYAVGLSGPARLHDHFVTLEAVTPGEYRSRGASLEIRHGTCPSPFGRLFLATTSRGVCWLAFPEDPRRELERLARCWSKARLVADDAAVARVAGRIFTAPHLPRQSLAVLVKGTNFQVRVWRALLEIPPGTLCSYQQVGRAVGSPGGARAVGQAVGANPVAYLIPCHRVVRKLGQLGGYAWGLSRKRALIAWEAACAGLPGGG